MKPLDMTEYKSISEIPCPIVRTQRIISGKWKIILIYMLMEKEMRFNEILHTIPELTQSTLSKQLKELMASGLVQRTSYNEIPPRVEYSLTEKGKAFSIVTDAMSTWGNEHLDLH